MRLVLWGGMEEWCNAVLCIPVLTRYMFFGRVTRASACLTEVDVCVFVAFYCFYDDIVSRLVGGSAVGRLDAGGTLLFVLVGRSFACRVKCEGGLNCLLFHFNDVS